MSGKGVMLVTGGSRGIGAATARLAAAAGYEIAISYRARESDAARVVADVERAGARALAVPADVGDETSVFRLFEAVDRFGPLVVLVNNAGVTGGVSRLADLGLAQLEEVLRVNVVGAFLCAREAVRRMSTARGGRGGSIVNVSSGAAQQGSAGVWIHYAATKGALDTMTVGLAKEVAVEGIRVNAVRPGIIDTDIHAARDPEQLSRMAHAIPMGRIGRPDEIARTILWLASPEASYVTGALLDVRGGF